ncbi:MAG: hypothetical protein ABJL67_05455 [Sulfitobacter sp.]
MLRKIMSLITPTYEDQGLFKRPLVEIQTELLPQIQLSKRGDMHVRGFIGGGQEITVVFAGRRTAQAAIVHNQLGWLQAQASKKGVAFDEESEHFRLKVLVNGSWRPKFTRDEMGWESHTHHLIAARWIVNDPRAKSSAHGTAPEIVPQNQ